MVKVKLFMHNNMVVQRLQEDIDKWQNENDVTIISAQSSISAREGYSTFPTITTIVYEDNSVKL